MNLALRLWVFAFGCFVMITPGTVAAGWNVAVTVVSPVSSTVHDPVPKHPPPDQPVKAFPGSAAGVSVTDWPSSKRAEQIAPQVMPAGEELTPPLPTPSLTTSRVRWATGSPSKAAITLLSAPIVTMHVPVPEQPAPDQ